MASRCAHVLVVGASLGAGLVLAAGCSATGQAPQAAAGGSAGDRASMPAAADRASCSGDDGPVVRVEGDQGYTTFEQMTWEPGTVFDARGAVWKSYLMPPPEARNCYPLEFGADWSACPPERVDLYDHASIPPEPGPPMCLRGGTVVGEQPDRASWHDVKDSAGAAVTVNATQAIVEGMRIHNVEDAFVPMKSSDFTIRGNWVTYNRDDCIENDAFAGGTIEDNLFDGCFTFYSAVNSGVPEGPVAPGGGADSVVTIRNNLIWMQNMPGPYKKPRDTFGYAVGFKMWDQRTTGLAMHDNIFLVEEPVADGELYLYRVADKVVSCSNNTLIWLGAGDFPEALPDCFRVIKDRSVWDQARQAWLEKHPEVARLPGDA
jgi:hypothetical protein